MKHAAEYLEGNVFDARRPRRDLQPVVAYADAVQAIEQALADAEKYRHLLMRAIRHAALASPASLAAEARVLPLYAGPERLAA